MTNMIHVWYSRAGFTLLKRLRQVIHIFNRKFRFLTIIFGFWLHWQTLHLCRIWEREVLCCWRTITALTGKVELLKILGLAHKPSWLKQVKGYKVKNKQGKTLAKCYTGSQFKVYRAWCHWINVCLKCGVLLFFVCKLKIVGTFQPKKGDNLAHFLVFSQRSWDILALVGTIEPRAQMSA